MTVSPAQHLDQIRLSGRFVAREGRANTCTGWETRFECLAEILTTERTLAP